MRSYRGCLRQSGISQPIREVKFSDNLTSVMIITLFQSESCPDCQKLHIHYQHCTICNACHSYLQPHCDKCNYHHIQNTDMAYCSKCNLCLMILTDNCECGQLLIKSLNPVQEVEPDSDLDSDEEMVRKITDINTQLQRKPGKIVLPAISSRHLRKPKKKTVKSHLFGDSPKTWLDSALDSLRSNNSDT
jgi:hypothetical protein